MSKPIVLIVTGDRDARESQWQAAVIHVLHAAEIWSGDRTLIHGACAGIDTIAHNLVTRHHWNVLPMWYIDALGRAGGPARNREMATVGRSLLRVGYEVWCYAFHDTYELSKGTRNMAETAQKFGIPVVRLCTSDGKVRDL